MKIISRILSFLLLFLGSSVYCQINDVILESKIEQARDLRILFYNCENYFDYKDDTTKNDNDFLPEGVKHWNKYKYYNKRNKIAKVITASGGWSKPDLVGLCEVENRYVLYDLTHNSAIYTFDYHIIHKESDDRRGIDVALLYVPEKYTPLKNQFVNIYFPDNPQKKTRPILYSKGLVNLGRDTLHVFVNHWPSRWGGVLSSEKYRISAAQTLRLLVDSLLNINADANIIIMGDFNDTPDDKSINKIIGAVNSDYVSEDNRLYNLSVVQSLANKGTIKYKGVWSVFDQFICSKALFTGSNNLYVNGDAVIMSADFLLKPDNVYLGVKPFRTYEGYRYTGGFSDHLPVFLDIEYKK